VDVVKKVLHAAERLFMHFGVRSVSMDDVARETSISKKTLYQCFRDKDDLVRRTLSTHLDAMEQKIESVMASIEDPIEQLEAIAGFVLEHNKEINPSLLYDLRKYHPDSFQLFSQIRETVFRKQIRQNLERGVALGLYRSDLDIDIISRLYLGSVANLLNPEVFPDAEPSFEARYRELIRYHLHGVASAKGIERLQHFTI
jgi:AcrR family transcriptional regulator